MAKDQNLRGNELSLKGPVYVVSMDFMILSFHE